MRSCSDVSPTAPASWPSKRSAYKAWPSLWKERRGCEPRAHSIEVSAETVTGTPSSGVVSLGGGSRGVGNFGRVSGLHRSRPP